GGRPPRRRRPCRRGPTSWCRSRLVWKPLPFEHSRSKGVQKWTAEACRRHYLKILLCTARRRLEPRVLARKPLQLHDDFLVGRVDWEDGFEVAAYLARGVDKGKDLVHEAQLLQASDPVPHGRHRNPVDPAHFARRLRARQQG